MTMICACTDKRHFDSTAVYFRLQNVRAQKISMDFDLASAASGSPIAQNRRKLPDKWAARKQRAVRMNFMQRRAGVAARIFATAKIFGASGHSQTGTAIADY
jgi:hypothetical protein